MGRYVENWNSYIRQWEMENCFNENLEIELCKKINKNYIRWPKKKQTIFRIMNILS